MSTAPMVASATAAPRPATPVANGAANQPPFEPAATNGQSAPSHDNRPAPAPPAAVPGKKGKQKKTPEPNEASKLIAQRITQLELDAAGEKDQEAEIGVCLPPSCLVGQCKRTFCDIFGGKAGAQVLQEL
jgi:hypothetical protein